MKIKASSTAAVTIGAMMTFAASPGLAVTITPTLPSVATVNGEIAITSAGVELHGPGVANFGPNSFGSGQMKANFGLDPSISLSVTPTGNNGGDSFLNMYYQVEYYNSLYPNNSGVPITATITAIDVLVENGIGQAEATISVGALYVADDCGGAGVGFSCHSGAKLFPSPTNVTMDINTVYDVNLGLTIFAHGGLTSAKIDPSFSAPAGGGGEFIFSQGVVTPIPAALPLFATGLGAMGLFSWRRKQKNALAAT